MKLASLLVVTAFLLGCGASQRTNTEKDKATISGNKATADTMATADSPMTPHARRAPPAARRRASPAGVGAKTPEALGRLLVEAIHEGDAGRALKLVPTRAEFQQLGLKGPASKQGYQRFIAKRRRGFARVVRKHRRKHPNCTQLVFSRLKKEKPRKLGKADSIPSVDLFARCDGAEIWLADPDGLVQTSGGWKLLEFN